MPKDNRPKILAEINKIICSGKGLSYEKLWDEHLLLCSFVQQQHVKAPIIAGRKPDGDWYSTYKSLLHAVERHRQNEAAATNESESKDRRVVFNLFPDTVDAPPPEVEA